MSKVGVLAPHMTYTLCTTSVVLLALLLWVGWPWAVPPPLFLGLLSPIPSKVGVVCDTSFFSVLAPVPSWHHLDGNAMHLSMQRVALPQRDAAGG